MTLPSHPKVIQTVRVRGVRETLWALDLEDGTYECLHHSRETFLTLSLPFWHPQSMHNRKRARLTWGVVFRGVMRPYGQVVPIDIVGTTQNIALEFESK